MVVVWLVLGVGLLAVELHHLAFYALFAALGAFAAGRGGDGRGRRRRPPGRRGRWATAAVGIVAVRPFVSRAVLTAGVVPWPTACTAGSSTPRRWRSTASATAPTPGHVRLSGERWLAVSGSGSPIEPGTDVLVTAVEGTTLTVWAVRELGLPDLHVTD